MTDSRLVVQAEGYLEAFLEIVAEKNVIDCSKAQEWLKILTQGETEQRMEIQRLNTKIFSARLALD